MDKVNPQGERYDCVLMDIEMPVMDGYTASRKVREAEAAGVLDRSIIIALSKLNLHWCVSCILLTCKRETHARRSCRKE
jgi:CheY-like chemotaxis protein